MTFERIFLDEWVYIPLMLITMLWAFGLGWVMGLVWLLAL